MKGNSSGREVKGKEKKGRCAKKLSLSFWGRGPRKKRKIKLGGKKKRRFRDLSQYMLGPDDREKKRRKCGTQVGPIRRGGREKQKSFSISLLSREEKKGGRS